CDTCQVVFKILITVGKAAGNSVVTDKLVPLLCGLLPAGGPVCTSLVAPILKKIAEKAKDSTPDEVCK
ncbi:hypothetical protein CRM22_000587, partial [Opisthorchis felineus]